MKKKILIADDNRGIQLLLNEFLKSEYEIETYDNGEDALLSLKRGIIPDLIIADVQMPKLNGEELIRQLKLSVLYKDIPVLVLSGIEKSQEKIKLLEAGAEDYIIKPFSPEELKVRISNILKRYTYDTFN